MTETIKLERVIKHKTYDKAYDRLLINVVDGPIVTLYDVSRIEFAPYKNGYTMKVFRLGDKKRTVLYADILSDTEYVGCNPVMGQIDMGMPKSQAERDYNSEYSETMKPSSFIMAPKIMYKETKKFNKLDYKSIKLNITGDKLMAFDITNPAPFGPMSIGYDINSLRYQIFDSKHELMFEVSTDSKKPVTPEIYLEKK